MNSFPATHHHTRSRVRRGHLRSFGSRTVRFAPDHAPGAQLEAAKATAIRTTFLLGLPR